MSTCNPLCPGKKTKPKPKPTPKGNTFKTKWTGRFPRPYLGEWKLYKNGNDVSFFIPTNLRIMPAYTYGEYVVWEEDPRIMIHQYVTDGYYPAEWIRFNLFWLQLIADTDQDYMNLFNAFHENDFRTSRFL